MSHFWRETLSYSGARLFAALTNLAVLFITARSLGPDGRGVLVTAITWVTALGVAANLSFGQVCHHHIQTHGSRADWLGCLLGTMLGMAGLTSVFVYLALLWTVTHLGLGDTSVAVMATAGLLIPLLVIDEYARNLLAAIDSLKVYSRAQYLGHALRLVFVVVAIEPLNAGIHGIMIALVASQCVIALVELMSLFRQVDFSLNFDPQVARSLLYSAVRLHPNTVAAFVLIYANVILLAEMVSAAAVAWYQFALQLIMALLLIPQGAATVMLGRIARIGPDAAWETHRTTIVRTMLVVALSAAALAVCAPPVIEGIAGSDFAPAGRLLFWLFPAVLGMALAELLAPQWYSRGLFQSVTALTTISALAHVALNWFLIHRHGLTGAALGMSLSYVAIVAVAQCVFAWWCESRYRKLNESALTQGV